MSLLKDFFLVNIAFFSLFFGFLYTTLYNHKWNVAVDFEGQLLASSGIKMMVQSCGIVFSSSIEFVLDIIFIFEGFLKCFPFRWGKVFQQINFVLLKSNFFSNEEGGRKWNRTNKTFLNKLFYISSNLENLKFLISFLH